MKVINGHPLAEIVQILSYLELWPKTILTPNDVKAFHVLPSGPSNVPVEVCMPDERKESIQEKLPAIIDWQRNCKRACDDLNLRMTSKHAEWMLSCLSNGPVRLDDFGHMAGELRQRFQDELQEILFVQIDPSKAQFYDAHQPFGEDVANKFPSIAVDAEEAAVCLALERFTACVFHLMRVMESGLRALGASLKDPDIDPTKNPTWERILKRCDNELRKPLKERSLEWRADELFFSTATANLRAVKDAWRNPTLHVAISYDETRSMDVFNAVKSFMRHLATKIGE